MKIAFLSIGNELLDGRVQDTNMVFAGRSLRDLGASLSCAAVVADDIGVIADTLRRLADSHDMIVLSGGAGPTTDDVTREAMALAAGVELQDDSLAEVRLREKFERFGVEMTANNLRQIRFPAGSRILPNDRGTADGCVTDIGQCACLSFPGVPREFEWAWTTHVVPLLNLKPRAKARLTLTGIGESAAAALVEPTVPQDVQVSYRASMPYIHIELKAPEGADEVAVERMNGSMTLLRESLAPWVVGASSAAESLAAQVETGGMTVSVAESCTGGLVASQWTDLPGASSWFGFGWVVYANAAKESELGVSSELLNAVGAVSAEVARAMAQGARERSGATAALSLTGIAGPGGGTADKPVGTVHMAVAHVDGRVWSLHAELNRRTRIQFKQHAACLGTMFLERVLSGRASDVKHWWGVRGLTFEE
jgi:nicotinamide-nucleotide amidase